jgi:DNA-binding MarR family transcriptional regulator
VTGAGGIPEEVLRFIETNVDSIEQLEILRLLGEQPERQWSAVNIAAESQIQVSAIGAELAALESRGLLKTMPIEGNLHCAYDVRTPEIEVSLKQLLQLYKERPVTLIKIVYARTDRLKAFADAFRVRKET